MLCHKNLKLVGWQQALNVMRLLIIAKYIKIEEIYFKKFGIRLH